MLTADQKDQRINEFAVGLKAKLHINGHNPPQSVIDTAAKKAVEQAKAQIDVVGISGHSFRVGTAQTLVENKATMPQLQTAGRWKDTRMPARYTEKEELAHGVIATILGK